MKNERFVKDRDLTYAEYERQTNMSYSQLKFWSRNPCSREASLSRRPILRNLRLKSKPREKWSRRDVRAAKKTISFLARHKDQRRGKQISEDCPYSKRVVALRNWAYDPL